MDVIEIVNAALDRMRQEDDLTEEELAKHLGVEASTLWRWRTGKSLGKSTRVLIPLVIANHSCEQAAEQAA